MATKNTKYAQLLLSRGILSKDVVTGSKINKCHISMIKNGYQNFTIKTLKKICQFHRCSPNDILDWEKWLDEAAKKDKKAV
jgi:DNA-binding Xre family transcriptional regulator